MLPIIVTSHTDALILASMIAIWIGTEVIWSRSRRTGRSVHIHDRLSRIAVSLSIWLAIGAAYRTAYADPAFAIRADRARIFDAGIALAAAGLALRWYSINVLGKYFTVLDAIQPGQTIISKGPYRWLRHPSYSGALLTVLGFGLALANWVSILAALALAAAGYSYRTAVEERALLSAFGEPYRQYMKYTKRTIPFVI